jgi:hypothetical protein
LIRFCLQAIRKSFSGSDFFRAPLVAPGLIGIDTAGATGACLRP